MKTCFLDTSFLLALAFSNDIHHEGAKALYQQAAWRYVTTESILAEFLDSTCGVRSREIGSRVVEAILQDPSIEVESSNSNLFAKAFDLYRSRLDKDWGLTDCISFVVMRERGIAEALTADHHFEQAGFKALLR